MPDIVDEYNNTKHSTIKMTPTDAMKLENEDKLKELYNNRFIPQGKTKFEIDDLVRIYKFKNALEKKSGRRFTNEIFKIVNVNKNTYPITYDIADLQSDPIKGQFYWWQLIKSDWNTNMR